jgi:hypothetical protein
VAWREKRRTATDSRFIFGYDDPFSCVPDSNSELGVTKAAAGSNPGERFPDRGAAMSRLGIGFGPEDPPPKKRIGYGFHIDPAVLKRVVSVLLFLAMLTVALYLLFTSFKL